MACNGPGFYSVKARYVDNREVDASSISVETLNGTVMLSGFAKNSTLNH